MRDHDDQDSMDSASSAENLAAKEAAAAPAKVAFNNFTIRGCGTYIYEMIAGPGVHTIISPISQGYAEWLD